MIQLDIRSLSQTKKSDSIPSVVRTPTPTQPNNLQLCNPDFNCKKFSQQLAIVHCELTLICKNDNGGVTDNF